MKLRHGALGVHHPSWHQGLSQLPCGFHPLVASINTREEPGNSAFPTTWIPSCPCSCVRLFKCLPRDLPIPSALVPLLTSPCYDGCTVCFPSQVRRKVLLFSWIFFLEHVFSCFLSFFSIFWVIEGKKKIIFPLLSVSTFVFWSRDKNYLRSA